ncbi:cathepsin O-like [Achroia grisella]|uniref:cathepsin O-like n=1 Tax=Achroia grisella TaxID=688607 RepID=UPI0027D2F159|nr:cathepsin O-like [Achroia grisella]
MEVILDRVKPAHIILTFIFHSFDFILSANHNLSSFATSIFLTNTLAFLINLFQPQNQWLPGQDGEFAAKNDITELNYAENQFDMFGYAKFLPMSGSDFENAMLMNNVRSCPRTRANQQFFTYPNDIPQLVDWSQEGVVAPVLDQKMCKASWSISVVGVIESKIAIADLKNGISSPFMRLSIQELIDCTMENNGCSGGKPATAIDFFKTANLPIVTEEQYPLTLVDQECKIPKHNTGVFIKKNNKLCNVKEEELLRLIARGPVVALVNAKSWQHYIRGVIKRACLTTDKEPNHVILIVGYDLSDEIPYYIVRNSWGENFGDNGYVKVAIGDNVCGIANEIFYIDVVGP